MKQTFTNPILSGFYPDPSICRVGEDYYMVTSSFAYYPGLPVFHSYDLVHWEQLGHGIHRPDQLDYQDCETSLGLWAPTLRYHQGTYYIINTYVSGGREVYRDNFIITAEDPAGPWSDPVFIKGADGIDPSLFFDDDGKIWYSGNYINAENRYEGHHGIYLQQLDPGTFQFCSERYIIWDGFQSRSKWIEAPHIYKKDGYYYLLVAEGGTFSNHSVMMARCTAINGAYEICPRNPIVSHRHLPLEREISVTGHGDLVETQNGEWWMVLLAVRPYQGFHYNTGRETFLLPVAWAEDGWLIVDNHNGLVNTLERCPDLPEHFLPAADPNDNFESDRLALIWNTLHQPAQPFYSLTERPGYLRLQLLPQKLEQIGSPALIARRQQDPCCAVKAALEFSPAHEWESAGITALQDDRYHYALLKTRRGEQDFLILVKTENGIRSVITELPLRTSARLYLAIQCNRTYYSFYYGYQEHEMIAVTDRQQPASLLSSTVNEGFTGAYLGMYASSAGRASENHADFDWFHYFAGH